MTAKEIEKPEPLAPSNEQLQEMWDVLFGKGKEPSLITLSIEMEKVSKDLEDWDKTLDESCEKDVATMKNMAMYMSQLIRLKDGYVASKNVEFIDNHTESIKTWKDKFGEADIPVNYDKHGLLYWINRKARRDFMKAKR